VSTPRVRDFHEDDLDQVVRVWEESRSPDRRPVYGLAEILGALRDEGVAVVVAVGEVVVGAAAARVGGDRAWVVLLALADDWRGRGLGSAMLTELEKQLMAQGVHRLSALLAEGQTGANAFRNCGYQTRDLTYFERVVPLQPQEVGLLDALGGRMLPRNLWARLAGMEHEKELIERRVVLPLVDPDLAEEYGVMPPRAIVLFGPPGTGKTTFAKAVASRLDWPFVEVFPSRLAGAGDGLALALRQTFTEIDELEHAVVFIDEVEEIAGVRGSKTLLAEAAVRHMGEALRRPGALSTSERGNEESRRRGLILLPVVPVQRFAVQSSAGRPPVVRMRWRSALPAAARLARA
jgi:transitional endoplasmic reticulum ATPase